jgi:tetratricopeptide (TPR) repeat protein
VLTIFTNKYKPELLDSVKFTDTEILMNQSLNEKDYISALKYAIGILNKNIKNSDKNTLQLANNYDKVASIYSLLKDSDNAKTNYENSLRIKLSLKKQDTIDISKTYSKIAAIYREKMNYNKSIKMYEQALKYQLSDIKNILDEEKGFFTTLQAMRFVNLRSNDVYSIELYSSLAQLYKKINEEELAKKYFSTAYESSAITHGSDNVITKELKAEIESLN